MNSNLSNKDIRRLELDRLLAEGRISQAEYDHQMERTTVRGPGRRQNAAHWRSRMKLAKKLLAEGRIDQAEHDRRVAQAKAEIEAWAAANGAPVPQDPSPKPQRLVMLPDALCAMAEAAAKREGVSLDFWIRKSLVAALAAEEGEA